MNTPEANQTYLSFLSILRRSTELLTDDPIKEEIFSIERLEQYAIYLAQEFKLNADQRRGHSLSPRMKECGLKLHEAYFKLSTSVRTKPSVSPAAGWFMDNFYIVEEQIWGIKRDLPPGFYHELPKLADGELKGYPRVYAMALAIIAHSDSRLDLELLKRFVHSFQQVSPLRIGELWAVPITLRIALVEHLTPLALRILSARQKREEADQLADQLLYLTTQPKTEAHELIQLVSNKLSQNKDFDRAFIVQLTQRLRDQDPDLWPVFDWLERKLQSFGTDTLQVTQLEHHRQAAEQVTVGNIITSMRFLSALDSREFVESVSAVDPILAQDPSASYTQMDFATRDRYRHSVERIAKNSRRSTPHLRSIELEVARKAIELACESKLHHPEDERRSHVGYYLIDQGASLVEKSFRYRSNLRERGSRFLLAHPTFIYLGALFGLTSLALYPLFVYFNEHGGNWIWACVLGVFGPIPASEFGLNILNHFVTSLMNPKLLPKMEVEKGIPETEKTMVVVPTLLSKNSVVLEMLEKLEVHFFANQDANIFFALLGDFCDADDETLSEDADILKCAEEGIHELNRRHANGTERFFLFHRRRQWNPSENKWMGWERKRGKILEFNQLLRGSINTSYLDLTTSSLQNRDLLKKIKNVITLDSDTKLPRTAAHRLIGTISHPLNRPRYSNQDLRVTEGYGILQPRVSVDLESSLQTRFALIFSGYTGIDPYTTAVSDVYQDLFSEGSFTGKGLYVVDAFEAALHNRGPENSVLSHDLFEGSYARTALVTDVELFDDYPSDYGTFSKRQHRWTRGDWQIAQWIFPRVPDAKGKLVQNNLPLISRWKIFDNLRRSLVAPALFAWLLLAWTVLPGSPLVWTWPVLIMILFPIYSPLLNRHFYKKKQVSFVESVKANSRDAFNQLEQITLMLAFLPAMAWNQTDAIIRTLYRKLISKRKLLEWVSFAQTQKRKHAQFSLSQSVDSGTLLTLITLSLVIALRPESLTIALFFSVVWLATPMLKVWLNRPETIRTIPLGRSEVQSYREYARRFWHYFEHFVVAESNWLAPDNFQESPKPMIAERTSPTNIGLQLLSSVSAYDFGYIGTLELMESVERVFGTLKKLQTEQGHFFNWYDTKTLAPLNPRYISTVDSGNLAGHLFALKQALISIAQNFGPNPNAKDGLSDTLRLILNELKNGDRIPPETQLLQTIRSLMSELSGVLPNFKNALQSLMNADDILSVLEAEEPGLVYVETRVWLARAIHQCSQVLRDESTIAIQADSQRLAVLIEQAEFFALRMNFKFLFDDRRKLFVIGYNTSDNRKDVSYYDLLASESRLASFIAIAKGDIPEEHWFRLGRTLIQIEGGKQALVAWTATMFEYLMPLLVMKRYRNTLLEQTYRTVVERQIEYGVDHHVPWGISECGYNARDLNFNYQYAPFGIPGLGLKRGLGDNLVVSPYSTLLACVIDPWAALANLKKLTRNGMLGRYGFYEAMDYTPERLPAHQKSALIQSFMVHHQGMSLISIDNLIHAGRVQNYFHAEPRVLATQLLLQERTPRTLTLTRPKVEEIPMAGSFSLSTTPNPRFYSDANVSVPRTQILSNGTHSVMLTASGSGYSKCGTLAVTRFREDWTRDPWGQFFYIKDLAKNKIWSSGYQPTLTEPDKYVVTFAEDRVEILRRDDAITTRTEIIVSPEDAVELRRICITNHSDEPRDFEVTSYLETVLARQQDDAAHPAFSNLFVQTEFVLSERTLLASRRKRSPSEKQNFGFHVVASEGATLAPLQYETDRARFIGRGNTTKLPKALKDGRSLSNTVGSVLDPIFSLRETVRVEAHSTVRLVFSTGVAPSREEALRLSDKYHDIHIFEREAEIAWTQTQVQLRHLNIPVEKAHLYQRLASRIIFSDPSLRPRSYFLAKNTKTQSNLWTYGISGDLPILLTRIADEKDMAMVRELLHAHEYLRLKGLAIDLVILNERAPSYLQALQDALQRQIRMSGSQALIDKPGGIFIRRTELLPPEDIILLKSIARVTLSAEKGTLDEQLKRRTHEVELPKIFVPTSKKRNDPVDAPLVPELQFFNGFGGFDSAHRDDYVIVLTEDLNTPAPWINVIANEQDFGFQISESGSGYTWSTNSRENRLTSWSNDAVTDPVSEAIYIRDEDTGEFWSPTPLPIRESETYVIRHSQGYSEFQHISHGIEQTLKVYVPIAGESSNASSVKISHLKLKNLGSDSRKLSVTNYVEWVLGFQRSSTAPTVVTEYDSENSTIFARNSYNNEFANRIAFSAMSENASSFTCNRKEFLGRNGSAENPAALKRTGLSGAVGAGLDPCAALQTYFELEAGEEKEIVILLGQTDSIDSARVLSARYKVVAAAKIELTEVIHYWDQKLSAIEIKTPDRAMNILVNRWLLYQTLSCRIWARSAFYQSGGAYGFRDQLQDTMALVYADPKMTKNQILRATARQFKEGDVQHWWHPPTGRGVRTHFSDDLLWLPFVLSFYLEKTGDESILKNSVSFIEAPLLEAQQDDSYLQPKNASESATVLEHCLRAIDRSLKVGTHGLPLMGSGDWNDGMNRVGHEGKGESVWVAWFLYSTIKAILPYMRSASDQARAATYEAHLIELKKTIEIQAWDGNWYRRAFFDNGQALGSSSNEECKIDSIAQSWAVLSGAGDLARAKLAMTAVDQFLIDRGNALIKLFDPPFDQSEMEPGYIKGYVPGVRENGGQYTHAAIWTVMAYAKLGENEKALELFSLLNPIHHASNRAGVHQYKVEPYVVAADVYGRYPHVGRGGWTWYTGSSSWMYRSALESILGFNLEVKVGKTSLRVKPCVPKAWTEFSIRYRFKTAEYHIHVINSGLVPSIELDGVTLDSDEILILDDGKKHEVRVRM